MSENYNDLKLLKAFVIKRMVKLKKDQLEFFRKIEKEKSLEQWLSVQEVLTEFGISRKTFDRWRINGLRVSQNKPNTMIRVKRNDIVKYLNKNNKL